MKIGHTGKKQKKVNEFKLNGKFTIKYMAGHAGGQRSLVNPGTKLWCPTVEVTQYWRPYMAYMYMA